MMALSYRAFLKKREAHLMTDEAFKKEPPKSGPKPTQGNAAAVSAVVKSRPFRTAPQNAYPCHMLQFHFWSDSLSALTTPLWSHHRVSGENAHQLQGCFEDFPSQVGHR